MPMRFKSQPFPGPTSRCSAPLCQYISVRFYACTEHCYALASHFASGAALFSTMPRLRCSYPTQYYTVPPPFHSKPWLRFASLCLCRSDQYSAVPCRCLCKSALSYALPQPCGTIPWHRFALLFPGIALLHSDAPCQDRTAHLSAFPFPCFSVQYYAQAFRCYALPLRRQSHRCHASASPLLAYAYHDYAMPGLFFAVPCPCDSSPCLAFAVRLASYQLLSITFPCRGSTHTFSGYLVISSHL